MCVGLMLFFNIIRRAALNFSVEKFESHQPDHFPQYSPGISPVRPALS